MSDDVASNPAEESLRERFVRGEIDAGEYQRSLGGLRSERGDAVRRGAKRSKVLIAGLAATALLTSGGVGAAYAKGGQQEAAASGNDMGSMMDGGEMGSMMCSGGSMGSMMGGGGMDSGQMMGSFDENKPFDLQFIDQMTMHHEGAIMSSKHMISDSKRSELRELAENIEKSQSKQIEQMQDFREEWYADTEQTSGMPAGMIGDGGMMGGSMQEMMGGDATDEMFLKMMIPHHEMAVDMAEKALEDAEHPELEDLARTIRDEQSAEIELMRGYLEEIKTSTETQ